MGTLLEPTPTPATTPESSDKSFGLVFAGAFALIGGWGGQPVRSPDKLLTPFHMDIAASIQAVLEEAVVRLTRSLAKQTGARNLCLAGGVALNCVANGKVLRDGKFDNTWVQSVAGDAGGSDSRSPLCRSDAYDQW